PGQAQATLGFDAQTSALAARLAGLEPRYQTPRGAGLGLNEFGLPCENALSATPLAGGMVRLSVTASCAPLARLEVVQDRLRFALRNSVTGDRTVDVPALSAMPVFIVEVEDGPLLTATAQMPDAAAYDRVALQWRGHSGLQIHAFEMGADYDDAGHVWTGNAHDAARAETGQGGFLVRLGDASLADPLIAEV
ncbi:hypothetical protein HA397_28705, partial [Escherichia coli]|nr:hypothetical protein [Escherichia coli]